MKQPELGRKISELRKAKGLTQEELVEKCNIGVRTIQRIEAGEVTPRSYTIKAILAALECDLRFISVEDDEGIVDKLIKGLKRLFFIDVDMNESSAYLIKQLNITWGLGLVHFILGFFESVGDYYLYQEDRMVFNTVFYICIKIAVLITYIYFQRGFILIGGLFKNYLLKIISVILIACSILSTGYSLSSFYDNSIFFEYVMGGFGFTFGTLFIVYGVALIRMKYLTGKVAKYAGIFSIITGCCFLTLIGSILAFIFLVPLVLSEIIMLYRVAETIQTKQKESGEASPSIPFS